MILCYSSKETDIWTSLLSDVGTEYAFIGRGLIELTNDAKLETLLDTLTKTVAVAVSSSTRRSDTRQVYI